jgi:hypothetical protein
MNQPLRVIAVIALSGLLLTPAAARAAATGPSFGPPSRYEWWFGKWQVQQQVWPLTEGAGVTVGVLDSGVQASVTDLRGVVLPGDDLIGGSPHGQTDLGPSGGHGTGVAALIAGQGNGPDIVGLAPESKILPVTVITGTESLTASSALISAGIRYAVENGAQVINMSFQYGTGSADACDPSLQEAVAYALRHNVVLVASAGNDNQVPGPSEPASCPGVLAVGGVEPDGSLWQYSTREPYVDIAAPADQLGWAGKDGRLYIGSGTSGASALVAAAAALIRSRDPSMPWYEVDQRITATAIPDGSPVPNDGYGYGILDPARAVNASAYPVSSSAPNPVYAKFQAWLSSPAGQAYSAQDGATRTAPAQSASARAVAAHSGSLSDAVLGVALAVVLSVGLGLLLVRRNRSPRNVLDGHLQAASTAGQSQPLRIVWTRSGTPYLPIWPRELSVTHACRITQIALAA